MIYLLDANVLIDANRDYYRIGSVNEFWEWLVHHGEQGNIKIPIEIYEEIKAGTDDLSAWAKEGETEAALRLDENVNIDLVRKVTEEGYAPDLSDIEIEGVGRDPFFIAYALVDPKDRSIVTTETPRPKAQRANQKIPDVCAKFGIQSLNTYQLTRLLDFKTNWKEGLPPQTGPS